MLSPELGEVEQIVERHPNIAYHGPFRVPEDLGRVYGGADLVWGAHAAGVANFRWARANRFYQAGWDGRPIIAQRGTQDGRFVDAWGLGPMVDLMDPDAAVAQLGAIQDSDLQRWNEAVASRPRSDWVFTYDLERLLAAMLGER